MENTQKAIFFDIDGTLWGRDLVIPESTKRAIKLLKENGHYTFLCTGRTRSAIRDEQLLTLGFDGILAGCGTYIEFAEEVVFHKMIENEIIKQTMNIFRKHSVFPILEGRQKIYADQSLVEKDEYIKLLKKEMGEDLVLLENDDLEFEVSKFSVWLSNTSFEVVKSDLRPWYDLIIDGEEFMEVVPKGFSKASGVRMMCEKLNIAQEDTYAFGDSANDIEMLKYVAHGIAMGNASNMAKEAADYITKDLERDGIYHGLKHFALI